MYNAEVRLYDPRYKFEACVVAIVNTDTIFSASGAMRIYIELWWVAEGVVTRGALRDLQVDFLEVEINRPLARGPLRVL